MKILITGVAGFIGFNIANKLLDKNKIVYGIDNIDPYYSIKLKKSRINHLKKKKNFFFFKTDITNYTKLKSKIKNLNIDYVFHFAAQPGVRYSLINPKKYYLVNVKGFQNLCKCIIKKNVKLFIYASSSSVYGDQKKFPIKENAILKAKNPYALSKTTNEKNAETYSKSFNLQFVGLRFFTVYGEWGRPDMFIYKLLNSIKSNRSFFLNNSGNHYRDFTYIKDVTDICSKLITKKIKKKHSIFNVCASNQINILDLTKKITKKFFNTKIKNIKANKADVYRTFGDNKKIKKFLKLKKFTNINLGLKKTIEWHNLNYKYLK
tara:strand:+ start:5282 stop:6241 length:960 start_codon:yes stop_codon:yes gene_type:complete